ncbi:MAG: hydroxylamine reductase [Veillonella sp.]|nr:hydroxylamine reductase [Veillonella sp.]
MSMFCYQCEQSAAPGGCTVQGVCGKTAPVANLQDELTAALVGLARALDVKGHTKEGIDYIMRGLFMCVTNVNFSEDRVQEFIDEVNAYHAKVDSAQQNFDWEQLWKGEEDIVSLRSTLLLGMRGMAAYAWHAARLGFHDADVDAWFVKGMVEFAKDHSAEEWLDLLMEFGQINLKCMAVLDKANTETYGTPMVGFDGCAHIEEKEDGTKDFSAVINRAIELGGYKEAQEFTGINGGHEVTTGFGHGTVLGIADKVIDAVKAGAIKHFFLVGGCDGAKVGRNYYTEFVKQTPNDTVVLTLACGKFRFNDMNIGEIGGIPRILDMGQCNDAYSAIQVAVALAGAFECDVNDLPLTLVLSWYEQKAVCILLTLLALGIRNIYIGPSLPKFFSSNVLNILVDKFQLHPITTPEADMKAILG